VQEATELAELFQKVDAVFASGNLQRISSLLATMQRSLTMVGNVPEFHGGIQKLEVRNLSYPAFQKPPWTLVVSYSQKQPVFLAAFPVPPGPWLSVPANSNQCSFLLLLVPLRNVRGLGPACLQSMPLQRCTLYGGKKMRCCVLHFCFA